MDLIALSSDNKLAAVQLFQMRAGKLVGRLAYASNQFRENLRNYIKNIYSKDDILKSKDEYFNPVELKKRFEFYLNLENERV